MCTHVFVLLLRRNHVDERHVIDLAGAVKVGLHAKTGATNKQHGKTRECVSTYAAGGTTAATDENDNVEGTRAHEHKKSRAAVPQR